MCQREAGREHGVRRELKMVENGDEAIQVVLVLSIYPWCVSPVLQSLVCDSYLVSDHKPPDEGDAKQHFDDRLCSRRCLSFLHLVCQLGELSSNLGQ
jgi:hypothetical protein